MHRKTNDEMENAASTPRWQRIVQSWSGFWFAPADSLGLHVARALFGLILLANILALTGRHQSLLGMDGWFDRQAYVEGARLPEGHPNLTGWSPLFAANSNLTLQLLFFGSIGVVACFTLGVAVRLTGVLTWLVVVALTTNPATSFGGDALLLAFAPYFMVAYLFMGTGGESKIGAVLGNHPLWRLQQSGQSVAANAGLRLIQVQIAIILVTSGLHKLQIGAWWAGVPLWFPLHPPFETTLDGLNYQSPGMYLAVLSLGAYAMAAWQISFPFVAWRRAWRPVVLLGGVVAAASAPLLYQVPLYGPITLVGCLAFVDPAAYRRVLGRWLPEETRSEAQSPATPIAVPAKSVA